MHQQQYEYLVVELQVTYDSYAVAIRSLLNRHAREGWRMKDKVIPPPGMGESLIIFEREYLPYKEYNKTVYNFLDNGNNI